MTKYVETGRRLGENNICPACRSGRLTQKQLCPHCLSDNTVALAGGGSSCRVCSSSFTNADPESVLQLTCDACNHKHTGNGWSRNRWHKKPANDAHTSLEVPIQAEGVGLFTSMEAYPNDNPVMPGTVSSLILDFDHEDPTVAARDMRTVVEWLVDMDELPIVWFSGNRGYHVVVPVDWGGIQTPHPLPGSELELTRETALIIKDLLNLESLDSSIYGKRRLMRDPWSVHEKTGFIKYPVLLDAFTLAGWVNGAMSVPKFTTVAGAVSSGLYQTWENLGDSLDSIKGTFFSEPSQFRQFDSFEDLMQLSVESVSKMKAVSSQMRLANVGGITEDSHPQCVRKGLSEGPPAKGTRSVLNRALASYFVMNGHPDDALLDYAANSPGASDTPKSERVAEMKNIHKWAQREQPTFRCKDMQELGLCHPDCPFHVAGGGNQL